MKLSLAHNGHCPNDVFSVLDRSSVCFGVVTRLSVLLLVKAGEWAVAPSGEVIERAMLNHSAFVYDVNDIGIPDCR